MELNFGWRTLLSVLIEVGIVGVNCAATGIDVGNELLEKLKGLIVLFQLDSMLLVILVVYDCLESLVLKLLNHLACLVVPPGLKLNAEVVVRSQLEDDSLLLGLSLEGLRLIQALLVEVVAASVKRFV